MQNLYRTLEQRTPVFIKKAIPESWRIWLGHQIKVIRNSMIANSDFLTAKMILPPGETRETLYNYLADFHIQGEESQEMLLWYLDTAFNRFLYTLQLVPRKTGKLLEIGANPYFISLLLHRFAEYELCFTNFFGDDHPEKAVQTMMNSQNEKIDFEYANMNVEKSSLSFPDDSFDVVLLCEVLEHFTLDPMRVLQNIKRVLKPNGTLVLTTPNVNRLENVARMLSGDNIYDPYSGYGAYGRHNREYNQRELEKLLNHLGFTIEVMFTSDIHENLTPYYFSPAKFMDLLKPRKHDLGQYIFIKAVNTGAANSHKPDWLYR